MNVKLQADLWSAAVSQHNLFLKRENGDGKMMHRCGADTVRPRWVKQIQGRGQSQREAAHKAYLKCVPVLHFCFSYPPHLYLYHNSSCTGFQFLLVFCGKLMAMFWLKMHDPHSDHEGAYRRHFSGSYLKAGTNNLYVLSRRQQINLSEHFRFAVDVVLVFCFF